MKITRQYQYTYVITVKRPRILVATQHTSRHAVSFRPTNAHRSGCENFELEIPFPASDRVIFLDPVSPEG